MNTDLAHILYVDDEEFNLTAFRATFRRSFNVHTALSAKEGEEILRTQPIEVIITDQRMPEVTGVEFLERARVSRPESIRMVLTGFADLEAIINAINKGEVYRYITKPWDEHELKMVIDSAVETYRLRSENKRLLEHLARYNEELEQTVAERTSELKRKSDDLESSNRSVIEQNHQITRLNAEKAELLALAGEDLQRPLKEILYAASHAIERDKKLSIDDAIASFITVRSAGTRIQAVLENLLLLNTIEKSGVAVFPTHLDPAMIVQTVVMGHSHRAKEKGITINFERVGGFGMAHSDPAGIQTIVDHLLSNALKFSPKGATVSISVEAKDGAAKIRVADQGPGFTDADRANLFTKFATHSAKPTDGELTTGLGLSIVKNYVTALQGTITLEPPTGNGAVFVVELPTMHR
ncbi:MAG: hybrid sensor histidine kinase/response regulator [Ignavibacteria bacterium]|nr:hybrid sensor histidine kinase/response regulator [Ignavibacteria bacterium]MBK7577007.1 hybrid sensor histidine kinase/response regulator [Ignavibacteria bacterium]MBK9182925.1 hybrid sensor histidine kinase/response regulator [Ignavibacteria bacterium]